MPQLLFLSSVPDALTELGAALHFYSVTIRYASSPQAKGKIERSHQDWQNRLPALCAAEAITSIEPANTLLENLCTSPPQKRAFRLQFRRWFAKFRAHFSQEDRRPV